MRSLLIGVALSTCLVVSACSKQEAAPAEVIVPVEAPAAAAEVAVPVVEEIVPVTEEAELTVEEAAVDSAVTEEAVPGDAEQAPVIENIVQ